MTATEVKERPILFSAPMVQAIIAGRKTQTRRVVKLRKGQTIDNGAVFSASDPFAMVWHYGQPGERLWVRETFVQKFENGYPVYNAEGNLDPSCYHFAADGYEVLKDDGDGGTEYTKAGFTASPWTPSIFMPRHASRILLEVTAVKVERVQDISEEDARAEGMERNEPGDGTAWDVDADGYLPYCCHYPNGCECFPVYSARESFEGLWHKINGKESWDANPFVWCISFKRLEVSR
jgi:hypothetical protein